MGTKGRGLTAVTRPAMGAFAVLTAALALAACGSDDDSSTGTAAATGGSSTAAATTEGSAATDTGFKPIEEGKLTVGMNLQFKPEMYLENGEPAGYDPALLEELNSDLGTTLNIQNLDFNGLIPGLQSNKFDMVSVGLTPTDERKQVVDFTRAYVPYALVLSTKPDEAAGTTSVDQMNESGKVITALQGSSGETLAKELFPDAEVKGFPDQNAAFLEVATGRADATVSEDYLLAQFQASNEGQLEKAAIAEPLDVQYGSWAVPKGNEDFVAYLDQWLCEKQEDGTLEELYKEKFEVDEFPPMPAC